MQDGRCRTGDAGQEMQDRRNYPVSSNAAGRVRRPEFRGVISSVLNFPEFPEFPCPEFRSSITRMPYASVSVLLVEGIRPFRPART
jgi:hypothetical protein